MKKLTLEVYLPAMLRSFDIQVPADMKLAQAVSLISDALSQLSGGLYLADSSSLLCDLENGNMLNINMTAWDLGLRNGSRLMLI